VHVLLLPVGSHGDVHPFVGLGAALARRGHAVEVITNGHFAPLAARAGLPFVELGDEALYREVLENPDLWHPRKAFPLVARHVTALLRQQLDLIRARSRPGETVLVGGTLAFGALLAREADGLPLASVHLQPGVLRSAFEPPQYPGFAMKSWWPKALKRGLYRLMDRKYIDPALGPGINGLRVELGLPPARSFFGDFVHSPDLSLGLFPPWFAAPQPDWPPQLELTGFPLYDEGDLHDPDPAIEAFLAAGPPPVVFTPGSANVHGRDFFEAALAACGRLGRRALLLTRFAEQVPAPLPPWALHRPYAPFGSLLPRAAAIGHHGGIGTCAQGLAAGIPQLLMPLAHDQYDNAARLERLGVARRRVPDRFTARNVARDLHALLDDPAVLARARALADRVRNDPGLDATAARIEATLAPLLGRGARPRVSPSG
jgi:rhamnosyltransferase subunit B